MIPRTRQAFSDVVVVELEMAKPYIQEGAPAETAEAIGKRFGLPLLGSGEARALLRL